MQKVPYLVVVGDREMTSGTVSVRMRGGKDLGVMSIDEFSKRLMADTARKSQTV